jgi:hypothetical protein
VILGRCTFEGCNVLTIGTRCVEHDVPVTRVFVRGRPFSPRSATTMVAAQSAPAVAVPPGSVRHAGAGRRVATRGALIST